MGYCIDDICHGGSPICGAGSPYHCRNGGPPSDDQCGDLCCWECGFDDDEPDPDDELWVAGFRGYDNCPIDCESLFQCSEAGDCIEILTREANP